MWSFHKPINPTAHQNSITEGQISMVEKGLGVQLQHASKDFSPDIPQVDECYLTHHYTYIRIFLAANSA